MDKDVDAMDLVELEQSVIEFLLEYPPLSPKDGARSWPKPMCSYQEATAHKNDILSDLKHGSELPSDRVLPINVTCVSRSDETQCARARVRDDQFLLQVPVAPKREHYGPSLVAMVKPQPASLSSARIDNYSEKRPFTGMGSTDTETGQTFSRKVPTMDVDATSVSSHMKCRSIEGHTQMCGKRDIHGQMKTVSYLQTTLSICEQKGDPLCRSEPAPYRPKHVAPHSHGDRFFSDGCNTNVSVVSSSVQRERSHHTQEPHTSGTCGRPARLTAGASSPKHAMSKEVSHKCQYCMQRFSSKSNLERHLRVHECR